MADSRLEPIYERLHGAPQYHPVNADTFADWAMEAGDVVTVSRKGEAYSAPVHSSTLRWRGKQQITINSEGAKERESIARMAKKKYGRGGSGVRNSSQMYYYQVNQEHLLYEVYDTEGRVSTLTVNLKGLYHEIYDTDGKFSILQNTANGLYHEVYDSTGKFSKLQNTADGLYHEVYDTEGRFSTLQNTALGLYHEVYDTDGKFSTLQNTALGLYHEVYDTDGKFSTLQNTALGLYHEVYDTDGKFSTLQNTALGLYHEVYDTDGKFSTLQNTALGLYHEVYDTDGKFSTLQNTALGLYHEVYDTDGKFSTLQNTALGLYHEVYDTDGKFSTLQNTALGLYHEVYDTDGKFSTLQNTALGLYHEVYDTDGKFSTLQNTALGLYHEVYDTDGKFSTLQNTALGLYHEVYDTDGKFSTLQNTANGLYHEVYDTDGKFSKLQNTANGLYHEVYEDGGAVSTLQNTSNGFSTRIAKVVDSSGNILAAEIATSINDQTGQSIVKIAANRVDIDGDTMVDYLEGKAVGASSFEGETLRVVSGGNLTIQDDSSFNIGDDCSISGSDGETHPFDNLIVSASVSGNTLTLTPLVGDAITFSKATSLGGNWSGDTLTVTASPQNEKYYVGFSGTVSASRTVMEVVGGGNATKDPIVSPAIVVPINVNSLNTGGQEPTLVYSKNLTIGLASLLQSKTREASASETSYTFTPDENKIGLISATINIVREAPSGTAIGAVEAKTGTITASGQSSSFTLAGGTYRPEQTTTDIRCITLTVGSNVIGRINGYVESDIESSKSATAGSSSTSITVSPSSGKYAMKEVTVTIPRSAPSGTEIGAVEAKTGTITANGQNSSFTLEGSTYRPGQTTTDIRCINLKIGSTVIGRINGYVESDIESSKSASAGASATSVTVSPSSGKYAMKEVTVTIPRSAPSGTAIGAVEAKTGTITANGQNSTFTLSSTTYRPQQTTTDIKCIDLKVGSNTIGRINNPYSYTATEYTNYGATQRTAGQNDVTISSMTWQYNGDNVSANNRSSNTVTASTSGRPTASQMSATIAMTQSDWSGNTKMVYVRRGSTSGEIAAQLQVTVSHSPTVSLSYIGYEPSYTPISGLNLGSASQRDTKSFWCAATATCGVTNNYKFSVDASQVYNNGYDKATSLMYFDNPGSSKTYMEIHYPESATRESSTGTIGYFHLVQGGNTVYLVYSSSTTTPSASTLEANKRAQLSVSHSPTASHDSRWESPYSLEDLLDRMSVSNVSAFISTSALARNTWYGFYVSCGSTRKYYYFHTS